jgi:hypothetical protein
MSDPFASIFGARGNHAGIIHEIRIGQHQEARQRAIEAYRAGIALPDVHIADRTDTSQVIKVVGEDGQEMTMERRRELMEKSGKRPMFNPDGTPTGEVYTNAFDPLVEPERFGKSAEENRPPIRIVKPRELDITAVIQEVEARKVDLTKLDGYEGIQAS